jgi:DNA-binding transcriptional ArsR family regulator
MKEQGLREKLGRRSTKTGIENRTRIFLTIAKEPLSFSQLVEKFKGELSKPVINDHLKVLERQGSIYKDTIKKDETCEPEKVGKVVYRASVHHIGSILMEALSLYDVLSEAFDVEKIRKESERRARNIPENKLRALTADKEITRVRKKLENLKLEMAQVVSDYLVRREERRRLRTKDREGTNNENQSS